MKDSLKKEGGQISPLFYSGKRMKTLPFQHESGKKVWYIQSEWKGITR